AAIPELIDTLKGSGFFVRVTALASGSPEDAKYVATLGREIEADWIVMDGYTFDTSYQENVERSGIQTVVIDDCGYAGQFCADVIVNQNISARETLYVR